MASHDRRQRWVFALAAVVMMAACGRSCALPSSPSPAAVEATMANSVASSTAISAFAGEYYGLIPDAGGANWAISVASTGDVTGSYYDSGSGSGFFFASTGS